MRLAPSSSVNWDTVYANWFWVMLTSSANLMTDVLMFCETRWPEEAPGPGSVGIAIRYDWGWDHRYEAYKICFRLKRDAAEFERELPFLILRT
jgi:hypothetical protein